MKWSLWVSLLPAGFCTIGTILNYFVMRIYLKDWCRKKGLKVCDQILLSMAFTSTSLQWVVTLSPIVFYMESHMVVPREVFFCLFVIDFFLIEATFWQLAILSTYYCVKLFDFTFSFFRWVKRLISGYTTQLLLISAAICLAINVPFVWALQLENPENVTEDTRGADFISTINIYYSVFKITCCCFPFAITFTCIVLSVGSLMRHVWRIRSNALQFSSSPQLGGHIQAAAIMVLCMASSSQCSMSCRLSDPIKFHAGAGDKGC
ncbi:PREDICTED: taste receptor type 2 member 60-like [Nanorana parkeri]|uniref:taste receptor type 2 member 60-like n=1 Tax=Nanorana parkeri TaxID=125878 RepID=UPI0008541D12|nr:PREDICTED: taste receptor type 2 member 60-like [Nanorana parkeri]